VRENAFVNADEIADEITNGVSALQFEVTTLAQRFVEVPRFFGDSRNFPYAHYGYLMACMGQIDLMSRCWFGPGEPQGGQAARMLAFMKSYLDSQKVDEHRVAIQLMRHTLMHTGALRYLYAKKTNTGYTWHIQFDNTLPATAGHYTLTDVELSDHADLIAAAPGPVNRVKSLNLRLTTFAADIVGAAISYTVAMRADPAQRSKCEAAWPEIKVQELKENPK
jgi:hypothetical protein